MILLLAANQAYAFPSPAAYEDREEEGISHTISEDSQDLSQSTLTGPNFFNPSKIQPYGFGNFYFQSSYIARIADRYIIFSKFISPGLDISTIIFPFHSFT